MNGENDRDWDKETDWYFTNEKEHENDHKWYESSSNGKDRNKMLDEITAMLRALVNIFDIISNYLSQR
ncbi:MAG: hypothetical protein PUF12_04930 [Thermoflexaceae bacterium]|nr:hypothetical protein [Thermoflexaceae bacterium]